MSERVYTAMKSVGVTNMVLGIILIAVGTGVGAVVIVNGVKMLKYKSELLF